MQTTDSEMKPPKTSVFLDTSVPNVARIFDYLAGGTTNFEVDRLAAEAMLGLIPSIGKWIRLRRAFIQEAASRLHAEGFRQFIDFGSGMPADDHIHAFAPEARIVFSDINPVAVSYGQTVFAEQDHLAYLRADVRDAESVFLMPEVRRLIHPHEPVAIGLNALMLFLSPADSRRMMARLHAWAPAGSKVFMVFQTRGDKEMPEAYDRFRHMCRSAGLPIEMYTYDQYVEMIAPWQPQAITPIVDFLGLPPDYITVADQTEIELAFYAVFLTK